MEDKNPIKEAGFKEEVAEVRSGIEEPTGYPDPLKRYELWYESEKHHAEDVYFWLFNQIQGELNFNHTIKLTDVNAASTGSSVFGDNQARVAAQQGQVQSLMATIGRMVKELFQIVRELRQLDERVGYYKDADKSKKDVALSAERTLKGIWIDLVEGGSQNPSSIIGLANQVGYSILPDLFFNLPPMKEGDVEKAVDALEFNNNVRNMLKRKQFQFLRWKSTTYTELINKRNFQIRYLAQHFQSIRMYMNWVKPYLRQIQALELQQGKGRVSMDSARIINSFQSSLTEIETLLYKKNGTYNSVILLSVFHHTMPSLDYHAKEAWQQKGPIHVGRTEMTMRVYAWTDEQIEKYKKIKTQQEWDMLMSIDKSLMDAMELLGEDLQQYLQEAEVKLPEGFGKPKKKEQDAPQPKQADPVVGVFLGLKELFGPLIAMPQFKGSDKPSFAQTAKSKKDKKKATFEATLFAWLAYKNYKKAHRMLAW